MCKEAMNHEENIINKIRKLLALADESRNNSEEEAIRAAMKAQSLMAKYDIDIKMVRDSRKQNEEIVQQNIHFKRNTGYNIKWRFWLAPIIAENFRVKYFTLGGDGIAFYGHKTDVEIAESVFNFLFRVGNKLSVKYYYRCKSEGKPTRGSMNEFLMGFCEGLKDELQKQCVALALVVPQDVQDGFNARSKEFHDVKIRLSGRSFDRDAFESGRTEGRFAVKSRQLNAG